MIALAARDLSVAYEGTLRLSVPQINFATRGLVGLIGANGAGKTTLLRALAGLVPANGQIRIRDTPLDRLRAGERARALAYLPQNAAAYWPLSVRQLAALGRLPHRPALGPLGGADQDAINWAMAAVDVQHLAERAATTLSGGERARVLLARALAVQASVLLVDEPVASLDPYHQLLIMQVLADYAADRGLVVSVLHDLTLAARFCARLVLIHQGAIVADGPPEQVLTDAQLARCYQIRVGRSDHDGPVIVPVSRVDS